MSVAAPAGARSGLSLRTKAFYGFGLSAEGIKNNAFNVFLLFYYQWVVGLDPRLCGLALFLAMLVDAVTDPAVGVWSDGLRSRWGRRHPFMYASSVPLAGCFLAVFLPPAGASQGALFSWLLLFAVGTRFSMTLFYIPHQALVAELSDDERARTALQTWRTVFAWMFGLVNALMAYEVFLRDSPEYPQGLLDPSGYRPFALWGASVMLIATFVSSLGTHRVAVATQPPSGRLPRTGLRQFAGAVRRAFALRSYRMVVLAGLSLWVGFGMGENLNVYLNTFFWGFRSEQLAVFVYVILAASVLVLFIAGPLVERFGKRRLAVICAVTPMVLRPGTILLRLLGVLPGDGDPMLLRIFVGIVFIDYVAIIIGMTLVGAMIADISDEFELATGSRQEGLLYAANAFLIKASAGLGTLVAGFVLAAAGFPRSAADGDVPAESVWNLGAFAGATLLVFGVLTAFFFWRYPLTRERLAEIQRRRDAGRSGPADVASS